MKTLYKFSFVLSLMLLVASVQSWGKDLQQIKLTLATTGLSDIQINATDGKQFTIDWGDGSTDTYTGQGDAWSKDVVCNHTYASNTNYNVTISGSTADCDLIVVYFYMSDLTQIDLSKAPNLKKLYCMGNKLTTLDVSNNTALTELHCGGNQLTTLDLSKNAALQVLECPGNKLVALDVRTNANLYALYCNDNYLTDLKVTRSTLNLLYCYNNSLSLQLLYDLSIAYNGVANLGAQQIENAYQKLVGDEVDFNQYLLTTGTNTFTVTLNGNAAIKGTDYTEKAGKLTFLTKGTFEVSITNDLILNNSSYNVPPRLVINILIDPTPKELTVDFDVINGFYKPFERIISLATTPNTDITIDWGDNTTNTYTEPKNGTVVNYTKTYPQAGSYKVKITSIGDISSVYCSGLRITAIDLSQCTALKEIYCSNNLFTSVDLSACQTLTRFSCPYNSLTSLDVSKNLQLRNLDISNGTLNSIDLSNNIKLDSVYLYNNAIPLNELYKISQQTKSLSVNNLGEQTLPAVTVTGNTAIDLSNMTTLGATETVFTVEKESDGTSTTGSGVKGENTTAAVSPDYTLDNGKLTLITNGTYKVTMTNESVLSNGTTKPSVKATYIKTSTTGISDLTSKTLKIYPNPTEGILNIETENNALPNVKLITVQGNVILQTQSNSIDLSPYEKGIYLLQIDGKTFKIRKD